MATQIETNGFVVCNPGGFYHQAVMRKGWCKADTWLVVGFDAWNKWYNEQRFTNAEVKVPYPACTGDTYEVAKNLCNELNKPIN